MNPPSESPIPQTADLLKCQAWTSHWSANPSSLPVSFSFDGKPIQGVPVAWHPNSRRRNLDASRVETVYTGTDPVTGLHMRVEWLEYLDYPVVEWAAWFTNTGTETTPLLSNILALDADIEGSRPFLHHSSGDFYSENGYIPSVTPLEVNRPLPFAPHGGRPCDQAFPYFRVQFPDGGLTMAVGWPAQWEATFSRTSAGVHIKAGQEKTNLRLLPGETIRTPRITLLAWAGDVTRAVNLWRRWYLAYILPKPDGEPLKPLLACCGTDEGEEFTAATEDNQLKYIRKFKSLGFDMDVWWIDAGWYECLNEQNQRRWWHTGTWKVDPVRFPNGLKPISDLAAKEGARLLVWFEPERVQPGTQLDREHPDWLLRAAGDNNKLLYLGNPECLRWLTDSICNLIQENGIKIYRQDHNFEPLEHWRSTEAEDRQGMHENLHVQGYLQFWDALLQRNPGLWIDSCSSGGRRNDLETMRRSVPLHYTDYGYGNHMVKLSFHHTLLEWIPYFKESTLSWDVHGVERFDHEIDSFSYHAGMAAMLFATLDIRRDDYDFDLAKRMIAIWRKAAESILYGDFYPLTAFHRNPEKWIARQFDRPELNTGFLQAFRLPACPEAETTLFPRALQPESSYRFENLETGETREMSAENLLQDGFKLALPPRSASIWFYRKTTKSDG